MTNFKGFGKRDGVVLVACKHLVSSCTTVATGSDLIPALERTRLTCSVLGVVLVGCVVLACGEGAGESADEDEAEGGHAGTREEVSWNDFGAFFGGYVPHDTDVDLDGGPVTRVGLVPCRVLRGSKGDKGLEADDRDDSNEGADAEHESNRDLLPPSHFQP